MTDAGAVRRPARARRRSLPPVLGVAAIWLFLLLFLVFLIIGLAAANRIVD